MNWKQFLNSNRGKVLIGIVIVIIVLALYFSIFEEKVCSGLQDKVYEEQTKINLIHSSCNVDDDCIYYDPGFLCGGFCINKNTDTRNFELTWKEYEYICFPSASCPGITTNNPNMVSHQCKCISNQCE